MDFNCFSNTKKTFIATLLPTTLGCLSLVTVSLVDIMLTSYYYGANGLAVVSLFVPLLTLWGCIYEGLGLGASSLYSQCVGAEKHDKGVDFVYKTNTICLIISILLAVIGFTATLFMSTLNVDPLILEDALWYGRIMFITTVPLVLNNYLLFLLRAEFAPRIAAISNGVQVCLNILLDVLFMGVLDYGIKGAALALLIASSAALSITLAYLVSKKSLIRLHFKIPECTIIKRIIPFTLNTISDNVSDFFLSLVINISVLVVFGLEIASIIYIINYVMMFVYYLGMGFSYSISPIISNLFGKKDDKTLTYIAHIGIKYAAVAGIFLSILIFIFSYEIAVYLFNYEYPSNYDLCIKAIRIYAISIPFYMINNMIICYCQQTERFSISLYIIVALGVFQMFSYFVSSSLFQCADGIWWGSIIAESAVLICWIFYMNNVKKKKHFESFLCLPKERLKHID